MNEAVSTEWQDVKQIHAGHQVTLGPQASYQWQECPDHLAMVLARYRAAAALIGNARHVLEAGCGEGIGADILSRGRQTYCGFDTDTAALELGKVDGRTWLLAHAMTNHMTAPSQVRFSYHDATTGNRVLRDDDPALRFDAAVSLDVIEHIPAAFELDFLDTIAHSLDRGGICVIGTPNKAAHHLASDASKAGHVNLYDHDRLHALMSRYFRVVQSFGMNDVALHTGHPEMRHYLMIAGVGRQ